MGDEPGEEAAETIKKVAAATTAAEIVAAISLVVASDGEKLFTDPEEAMCWAVAGTVAGVAVDHASATPSDRLRSQIKSSSRKIAACFRGEVQRAPSPPELIDAFAFALRKSKFAPRARRARSTRKAYSAPIS